MKDFLPVLKILLRFVIIYIVFVLVYQLYLNNYANDVVDPFTRSVANQVAILQNNFGYTTELADSMRLKSVRFLTSGQFTTRMVEGCNAISVAILFVAFIFAFYKGKKTFVFVLISLVIIHLLNVIRIALLNVIYLKYPQCIEIGHDYIFPAIIYGCVIILWLIWIQYFALKNEKNA